MLVCHCSGVSDRALRKHVREGHITVDQLGDVCGAGAVCGGCVGTIEDVVHTELAHQTAGSHAGGGATLRTAR